MASFSIFRLYFSRVQSKKSKNVYALKKLQIDPLNHDDSPLIPTLSISSLREITLLKKLNHVNILNLKEVLLSEPKNLKDKKSPGRKRDNEESDHNMGSVFLLMEYCEQVLIENLPFKDLGYLIDNTDNPFSLSDGIYSFYL